MSERGENANAPQERRDASVCWLAETYVRGRHGVKPRDAFTAAGRTPAEQGVFTHVQKLTRLRAERSELRWGAMEHMHADEQTYVYRRGRTVVALNNGTKPAEIRLSGVDVGEDALGLCAAPRRDAQGVTVTVPARTGCVF